MVFSINDIGITVNNIQRQEEIDLHPDLANRSQLEYKRKTRNYNAPKE